MYKFEKEHPKVDGVNVWTIGLTDARIRDIIREFHERK